MNDKNNPTIYIDSFKLTHDEQTASGAKLLAAAGFTIGQTAYLDEKYEVAIRQVLSNEYNSGILQTVFVNMDAALYRSIFPDKSIGDGKTTIVIPCGLHNLSHMKVANE